MLFFMAGNLDFLLLIELVAVYDGIVDRFRQADQNIWIEIFIYMQTFHQILDKGFNLADTTGM